MGTDLVLVAPDTWGEAEPLSVGLHSAGYTLAEICERTGQAEAEVASELAQAGATLTPAHLLRVEHAALEAALPGTRRRQYVNKRGDLCDVLEQRPADMKAAALVLAARSAPYGAAAAAGAAAALVLPAVLQVARNMEAVNAARRELGLTPYESLPAGPPSGPVGR